MIGGGLVGLATARALLRARPGAGVLVVEKETTLASHQSGHNSGVIHAGIYYAPGSLKARLCRAGQQATKEFCRAHGIPFAVPGKLVVATSPLEVTRLRALRERAVVNGIRVEPVSAAELHDLEPAIAGLAALLVPDTGIVDYRRVAAALASEVIAAGGQVHTGVEVTGIREEPGAVRILTNAGLLTAGTVLACAGLQADRVARLGGLEPDFRIVPFRGEFFSFPPSRAGLVDHLIYPVPDPGLPFLGVHLTPQLGGGILLGPNAVLGLAREGYPKSTVSLPDIADYARYPGMWRLAAANVSVGWREARNSVWRTGFLRECRRYCPQLERSDLRPHPAGIRAQAVLADGSLVHDFLLRATPRQLHVANAPSPAATSAIPIGEAIAARLVAG